MDIRIGMADAKLVSLKAEFFHIIHHFMPLVRETKKDPVRAAFDTLDTTKLDEALKAIAGRKDVKSKLRSIFAEAQKTIREIRMLETVAGKPVEEPVAETVPEIKVTAPIVSPLVPIAPVSRAIGRIAARR
jgi:hypothetical protein